MSRTLQGVLKEWDRKEKSLEIIVLQYFSEPRNLWFNVQFLLINVVHFAFRIWIINCIWISGEMVASQQEGRDVKIKIITNIAKNKTENRKKVTLQNRN